MSLTIQFWYKMGDASEEGRAQTQRSQGIYVSKSDFPEE